MTMLDVSIVNVALPSMAQALDASPTSIQIIVAGYSLAFGIVLVPAGRLGDTRGRRTMFVVGLAVFAAASAMAGFASSDVTLSIARIIQGLGAGLVSPQIVGLIQQLFRGLDRAKALGLFGAAIGVSTATGPLLGGIILQLVGTEHGWRWIFFINIPIVLVVIPAALRLLPTPEPEHERLRLDVMGLILIAVGALTFMLPFVTTTGVGDDPRRWWWLAVSGVIAAALLAWEWWYVRRGKRPVLDPEIVFSPSFMWGLMLGVAYFAGFTSVFLVVMLYLQQGLGFTPLMAGLVSMPNAICSAISAGVSSRFIRYGRRIVIIGLAAVAVGFIATDLVARLVEGSSAGWLMALTLAVAGVGSGFVIAPNQTLTLADVPVNRGGTAAGLLQTGQRFGSAVGVSLVLSAFYATLASYPGALEGRLGMNTTEAYGQALGTGMLVTIGMIFVALIVGVVDARRRSNGHSSVDAT